MGAHLYFKLAEDTAENARRANEWLSNNNAQAELGDLEGSAQGLYFFEEDYYPGIAAGTVKTSSIYENREEAMQLYASVFASLHKSEFEVKILTKSCSLRLSTFNLGQMLAITDGGDALSGEDKEEFGRILHRAKRIRPFPSTFVDTFSEEDEMVVSEIPNLDLWEIPDRNLRHRLNDLLRDRRRLKVFDLLLALPGRLPISVIADELELDPTVVQKKLEELSQYHIVREQYGDYSIDPEHELTDDLEEMHNRIAGKQIVGGQQA